MEDRIRRRGRRRPASDLDAVLGAIARTAAQLCEATDALIYLVDGDQHRLMAKHGTVGQPQQLGDTHPIRPDTPLGRAVLDRQPVHVRDITRARDLFSGLSALQLTVKGVRTVLAVPMLRDGAAIGGFVIRRTRVQPFARKQIALLKTFADQAAIAIENARLSEALNARNRDLTEALGQQTATAEILRVISRSATDVQPVFDTIAANAVRVCGAHDGSVFRFDAQLIHLVAHHIPDPAFLQAVRDVFPRPPGRGSVTARAILTRAVAHVPDVAADPEYEHSALVQTGSRTILSVPMLRDGNPIGAITVTHRVVKPFSPAQIALLQTFADQAVIAIENVRLFTELQARNHALTEALEQRTATSEILGVISSSPTDVQPVFDTIVISAGRLCGAESAVVYRFQNEIVDAIALYNLNPAAIEAYRRRFPRRLRDTDYLWRVADGSVLNLADIAEHSHSATTPEVEEPRYVAGMPVTDKETIFGSRNIRSFVLVPMVREGRAIGAIGVSHHDVGAFSSERVRLLQTFADQAVIAIENVRLFTELQARNRDLATALDQQTATAEILRTLSRSYTDVRPVFQAIVDSAAHLLGGHSAVLSRIVDDRIDLGAYTHTDEAGDALLESLFPVPLHPSGSDVRPIRDHVIGQRIPYNVADIETDPRVGERGRASARARGYRSQLVVPMLRDGDPIGALAVTRREPGAFTDEETALLQTFADQAVIAIENVRLVTELQERNRALSEALEQQTATAEMLRVISGSPTDIQPVLTAMAESAARLCDSPDVSIFRVNGNVLDLAVHRGPIPSIPPGGTDRVSLDRGSVVGRSVLERRTVHVADLMAETLEYPEGADRARRFGARATLSVPLLRDNVAIGAIAVRRTEARLFSERQIALLQTFADQAVIAIENVRLFTELEARNRDLTEALEQQTATAEILRAISRSATDLQPVFEAIARNAVRVCNATDAVVALVDGRESVAKAHYGDQGGPVVGQRRPIIPGLVLGRALLEARPVQADDVTSGDEFPVGRDLAIRHGHRTVMAVPLLRDGIAIGGILMRRSDVRPFTDKQIELLQTFADQAVIAIENVRLFTELQEKNRSLGEALERQTATSEILRVISQSPTDVHPVFDAILASSTRLCEADYGILFLAEGDGFRAAAFRNVQAEFAAVLASFREFGPKTGVGRLARDKRPIHIPDLLDDDAYREGDPTRLATVNVGQVRTWLGVPLLKGAALIGAIVIYRKERRAFTNAQIALVETFADQAVIAMENVRLFNELKSRTEELTGSVRQLTALGEVGQAVSSTLDLETVLTTIASRAAQLTATDTCTVYEYDEGREEFHLRATHNVDERVLELTRVRPIRKGEGATGRVAETHAPVEIEDVAQAGAYHGPLRQALLEGGVRSVLAVPLLCEARLIGVFIVSRKTPGRFAEEVVAVLQTFATQSAIAIHNARLYRELEAQSRELEAASRHKSQFLANMSHELRTPMNAIIGYTELIADGIYGAVPEPMRDVLTRVDASGRHLLGLINDVLDLSKIEAGQLTLTLAEYSMKEVVESVLAAAEPLAAEKRLKLVVDIPPDLPTGRGDQRRLAQVLLNLVGNAIKFTDEGNVAVRVGAAAGMFAIAVSDTGPGIPLADRERIFEEFQQADTSHTRPKGGTGLGLAIARRIVTMHGGRIWVESTPGAGATFRITMPTRVEEQVAVPGARS